MKTANELRRMVGND